RSSPPASRSGSAYNAVPRNHASIRGFFDKSLLTTLFGPRLISHGSTTTAARASVSAREPFCPQPIHPHLPAATRHLVQENQNLVRAERTFRCCLRYWGNGA